MKTDITIKAVKDVIACQHIQILQERIWAAEDDDIIPNHVLVTLAKNNAPILAAYATDGPAETEGMVGFVLGWLAYVPTTTDEGASGTLKYCSHIAGVHPQWQGQSISTKLKLAQRETILGQGLTEHITWTYDPLNWINGVLNIHRLGATCQTYYRNVYGEMNDQFNRGLPSDRCQVDWHLNSPRVLTALEAKSVTPTWDIEKIDILKTDLSPQQNKVPPTPHLNLMGQALAVPLPDSVRALRAENLDLVLQWRLFLREVFEASFSAGYLIVDCVNLPHLGWHYILAPNSSQS